MLGFLDYTITQCGNEPVGWFDTLYVSFNWFEAAAWFALALFIWGRFLKYRRTKIELSYGFYVFVFGVTDVLEVYELTVNLLLIKAAVLCCILACRAYVIREYRDLKHLI